MLLFERGISTSKTRGFFVFVYSFLSSKFGVEKLLCLWVTRSVSYNKEECQLGLFSFFEVLFLVLQTVGRDNGEENTKICSMEKRFLNLTEERKRVIAFNLLLTNVCVYSYHICCNLSPASFTFCLFFSCSLSLRLVEWQNVRRKIRYLLTI